MKFYNIALSISLLFASTTLVFGQWDPNEMILREKQNLYKKLADLSEDQKLLLDGIYDEFGLSFKELIDEVRQTRNWETMRPKMQALRKEKDDLISDVLNEDQYAVYYAMVESDREARRKRFQQGQGRGSRPGMQKRDSTDTKED